MARRQVQVPQVLPLYNIRCIKLDKHVNATLERSVNMIGCVGSYQDDTFVIFQSLQQVITLPSASTHIDVNGSGQAGINEFSAG